MKDLPKESVCGCQKCVNMCWSSPCFPTPDDALKLIEAGHKDKLSVTCYVSQDTLEYATVISPIGLDWGHAQARKCVFLDSNNLCTLHECGLKPTEGKILDCSVDNYSEVRLKIVDTWNTDKGKEVIKMLLPENHDSSIDELMKLRFRIMGIKDRFATV